MVDHAPQTHLRLATAVRPPRVGLLVPTKAVGASWLGLFEAAIAAQARFWGGSGNLIFPLGADLADQDMFWEIADRLDADAFVTYAPAWRDWEEFAPEHHQRTMVALRDKVAVEHGAQMAERFVANQQDEVALHVRPIEAQLDLIRRRLAPFHFKGSDWILDVFNGTNAPFWPLMDAGNFVDAPRKITNFMCTAGGARKLLLTAITGRITGGFRRVLSDRGVTVEDERAQRNQWWAVHEDGPMRSSGSPVHPWAISEQGLALYRRGPWRREEVAVVAGNSPSDFALFYALRRLTGLAWWLPSWLSRDQLYLLELTSAVERAARSGREPVVVSASSSRARNRQLALLIGLGWSNLKLSAASWRDVLPEEPLRFYERDNVGRSGPVQLVDGETLDLVTPVPRHVRTVSPTDMCWIAEVQCEDWTPVRHAALGVKLLRGIHAATNHVRTTRDGIAYYPLQVISFGCASLDSSVVRPTLRALDLTGQVNVILEQHGWSCEASDKGVYAIESMRLLGGFGELCSALRHPRVRAIIDAYRPGSSTGRRLTHDRRRVRRSGARASGAGSGSDKGAPGEGARAAPSPSTHTRAKTSQSLPTSQRGVGSGHGPLPRLRDQEGNDPTAQGACRRAPDARGGHMGRSDDGAIEDEADPR